MQASDTQQHYPDLATEVADYLDRLAAGLSKAFPGENFQHLELFGRLGVIARLYDELLRSYLAPYEVMPVEHQVLVTLRSGVAAEPAELANATRQTRAGMTGTLDRLEKRKLIKRVPHPADRRKRIIVLTRSGTGLTDKLVKAQNQALAQTLKPLSTKAHQEMDKKLDLLISLLAESTG